MCKIVDSGASKGMMKETSWERMDRFVKERNGLAEAFAERYSLFDSWLSSSFTLQELYLFALRQILVNQKALLSEEKDKTIPIKETKTLIEAIQVFMVNTYTETNPPIATKE